MLGCAPDFAGEAAASTAALLLRALDEGERSSAILERLIGAAEDWAAIHP